MRPRDLACLLGALVLLAVSATLLAGCGGGSNNSKTTTNGQTIPQNASVTTGERLFRSTCATCHTLHAAGSTATIGPNLDYVQPTVSQTQQTIAAGMHGSRAIMPAGLLRGQNATDVAAYLAQVANRANVRPNPKESP